MLIALLGIACLILVVLSMFQQRKIHALWHDKQAFRTLAEDSPDLIFRYDREGRRLYVNPAVARLFRKPVEEIVGQSPADSPFLGSAQNRKLLDGIRRVFETGEKGEVEVFFADQTEQIRSHYMLLIPECNADGQVNTVLGLSRDITAIREAEQLVSNLAVQLPGFVFKFRMSAEGHMSFPFASPRIEEFFGLRPEDVADNAAPLHAMTHPEDAFRVFKVIVKSARTLSSLHMEYRLLRPGYPERWMEVIANPEPEADGGVLWYGIFLDITERKHSEQDLKQALESIDGIVNAIPDLLFEFDRNGTYLNVWASDPTLLAAQKEALLGNTIRDVLLPDAAETAMSAIEEADRKGSSFGKVIRIALPRGERWFELSVSRKPGPSRTDRHFIGLSRDITERKRMELQLAARERELRTLMENLPANISRYTPDARGIYANPSMQRLMGSPADVMQGKTPMEVFPDGRFAEVERYIRATAASGGVNEMEVVVPMADGEVEYHLVRLVAEHDEKGAVVSVLAIGTDISDHKRAELALAARERELRTLLENIPDNIARYTPDARHVYMSPVLERFNAKPKEYFLGRTPMECFPDGRFSEYERRVIATAASGSCDEMVMTVPMADGEVEYHLIRFVPERDEKGAVVSVLAIGTDITERKRAELQLATRERELRSLMDNIPANIARYTPDARSLYLNPSLERTIDVPKEHYLGRTPMEISPDGRYREYEQRVIATAASGSCEEMEMAVQMADGKVEYHLIRFVPERDEKGAVVSVLSIGTDITERKRAELALTVRERELATLLDNIPDNIARYTPDARLFYMSPVLERFNAMPKEYFLGRTPMECFPDGSFDEYERRVIATAASGSCDEMEVAVPMGDGKVEYHLIRFVPERDEKGAVVSVLAIGTDITQRRRVELALEVREREFRSLAESLPDNIIRYDREGVTIYVNPVLERTLGESAAAMIGTTPREFHADGSFEDYAQLLDAVLASGEAGELEKLFPGPNGETCVEQIRMVPEFDGDGEVVGVLAIGRDITERKRAEEKLRLAASVFINTNEGIIVSDADNRILDVNDAFTRITGYTRKEAIGKNPSLLSSRLLAPGFYAEMWRTLGKTGHWKGELWNQRKNGEVYAEWLTISVVKDEQGKVSHYVGVFTDITLIKEHERQLKQMAHYDALTGLPNRLLFMDRLKQAVAQAQRSGDLLAVCYSDLDGFKPVNDRFGHEAGDNVLITIGRRMQECVRAVDTVGRIGGDEFVLLLLDLESVEDCEMILARLLERIAQPIRLDGHTVSVTASLGIVLFPQDDADPDTLLRHADRAMYLAKRSGKSIYRFFDPGQA